MIKVGPSQVDESIASIRVELSAIRGFWQFMVDVEAFGVFFNVATGVKVKRPKF